MLIVEAHAWAGRRSFAGRSSCGVSASRSSPQLLLSPSSSDRARGEQLGMCTWRGLLREAPAARHVSSQKTLGDVVLPEHGKDNWYRDTVNTTVLTRGYATLWDSIAVIATGLSRTCTPNGGTSSGTALSAAPALFLARCDVCGMGQLICVKLVFWILKPFLAGLQAYVDGGSGESGLDRKRNAKKGRPEFEGCWRPVFLLEWPGGQALETLVQPQRRNAWPKVCPWSPGVCVYVAGLAWVLSRVVCALPWRGVPSCGAGAFLDWWTYQRHCASAGAKVNTAES